MTNGKTLKTKHFYVIMYATDIKMVFRKSAWFTSKAKAKEYYADDYTKVLTVTDDVIEALELTDKYIKEYEKGNQQ